MSPAEPQRSEPEPPVPPAKPQEGRPDWLVGAEEGVVAERDRDPKPVETTRPVLKMVGSSPPAASEGEDQVPELNLGGDEPRRDENATPPTRLTLLKPQAPESAGKKPEARKTAWVAAGSSVPTLRREPPPARPAAVEPRESEEPRGRETVREVPDDRSAPAPVVTLPPLKEPWWIVALEEARTNRMLQIAVAAVVVGIAVYTFWPRREPSMSIEYIQRHAQEMDGRAVTLHGRVGDVFAAGGGHTFYLTQGNATIVVFSRSRVPVPNQSLTVHGTISTGFLDGSPHQSLFEDQ